MKRRGRLGGGGVPIVAPMVDTGHFEEEGGSYSRMGGGVPIVAPMVDIVKRRGEARRTARFITNDGTTASTAYT